MKNLTGKLGKWWEEYWDWIMKLPVAIYIAVFLATTIIPVLLFAFGLIGILDAHLKAKCLDSELARRWTPTNRICEEYHDGEWIKVNLSDNIYYYNDTAARSH